MSSNPTDSTPPSDGSPRDAEISDLESKLLRARPAGPAKNFTASVMQRVNAEGALALSVEGARPEGPSFDFALDVMERVRKLPAPSARHSRSFSRLALIVSNAGTAIAASLVVALILHSGFSDPVDSGTGTLPPKHGVGAGALDAGSRGDSLANALRGRAHGFREINGRQVYPVTGLGIHNGMAIGDELHWRSPAGDESGVLRVIGVSPYDVMCVARDPGAPQVPARSIVSVEHPTLRQIKAFEASRAQVSRSLSDDLSFGAAFELRDGVFYTLEVYPQFWGTSEDGASRTRAARFGLRAGDEILSADHMSVHSVAQLNELLPAEAEPFGSRASLIVKRDGKRIELHAR